MNIESFNKNHWCPRCQAQTFEPRQSIVTMAGDDLVSHVACTVCHSEFHIKPTRHYTLFASKKVEIFWTVMIWLSLWSFVDYMRIEVIYPVLLLMGYALFGWTIPFPSMLNPPRYVLQESK